LRVLLPEDSGNYRREHDLVPAELWGALQEAQIVITNYHTFLPKDAKEIAGVASNTRKILTAGKAVDPFRETADAMISRVLRDLTGRGKGEIVVFSDEAHHCYQSKPVADPADEDAEAKQRNEDARVWFRGLKAVQRIVGIKTIYDLSATPFYLKGSGYNEGYIFPWVVSDFSLMDAIESGIVKVPRIPVDDDAKGDQITYLHLRDHVGIELPTRLSKAAAPWARTNAINEVQQIDQRTIERPSPIEHSPIRDGTATLSSLLPWSYWCGTSSTPAARRVSASRRSTRPTSRASSGSSFS
jgi:type III restriction enzyme